MNGRNISLGIIVVIIVAVIATAFYFLNRGPRPDFAGNSFQKTQVFTLKEKNNSPLNILATVLPKFVVSLADSKFSNVWTAYAQNVDTTVINAKGEKVKAETTFDSKNKQLIVTPQSTNDFNPGLYQLNVKVKTYTGKDITITQDFTWGVLAINTGKAIYKPGETVKIGMGVLDNRGNTKCIAQGNVTYTTAKIWLTITSPSGKTQNLSTDDGTIVGSKECAPTSVTNNPDFQAEVTAGEVGRYTIHMTAENINGTRSIDDYFTVSNQEQPFVIMRTSYPTRIYPYGNYPVEITVVANQDYSGTVSDHVPSNFRITDIAEGGNVTKADTYQQLNWQVNWTAGQTYTLDYTINFPLVSPEFYLVGPLTIGNYSEGREWMIASDAITLVQSESNSAASGTSLSATYSPHPVTGDLEVIICAGTTTATITAPTRGSGTPRPNSWSTGISLSSTARFALYYRIATTSDATSYTCGFSSSTGGKSMQMFEYSGISTATPRDLHKTHSGSCSSGTFTSNTSTATVANPIELVMATFVSTTFKSVNAFTSGYTQEFNYGGGGTTGTFTTDDQVTSSIADYTDTLTYSGNAGNCVAGIISFITPIDISQNGFQFYQNNKALNPVTAIGTQNTNLTLPAPHSQFRIRMLLDVDGTQSLGLQQGDFELDYATLSAQFSGCDDPDLNYDAVSTPGTGTDIAFLKNGIGNSGQNISTSTAGDPADSGYTTTLESYYDDDDTSAGPTGGTDPGAITNDQNALTGSPQTAGEWDFSLVDNTNDIESNIYCLKLANSGGSDLSVYIRYPEVTTFYNEVNILGGTTIKSGTTIK